ncbi:MAG TPA: penicillin-binding protein 1C [Thermoanaerobaculia bacterium]|nr:penicillin-binding protein 1C [Thermoanaerobaculia bacterium]
MGEGGRGGEVGRGKRRLLVAAAFFAAPFLIWFLLNLLFPFPWETLNRPPATVVTDHTGEPLRFFLPTDHRWRFPVRLAELPPELPEALVASEDQRFRRHLGVDPVAVVRAAWSNVRAGEVVSGASTIPMQIARMAVPGRRTLGAKVRESFRALQLEARFSKDELLEIYLNLTPYGGNVEGVGAAAWFYFGKSPDRLSLGEIALLTAFPRSPVRYDPTLHPAEAQAARDRVLRQLAARGVFPQEEIEHARAEPLPSARRRPPFAAPHLAELAAKRLSGETRIRTSLDRDLQSISEEQVARRIGELRATGIGNAAVVVIENETRAVRALVGSAGFAEAAWQGQVNGAVARRSPGSTLKPFLYAMALDQGRVIPDSWLLDVPTDFSGYVAENYDERYRGLATVRDALIQSLNASAVRLLAEIGLPEFHRLLVRGGLVTLDRPAAHYGLPLVLGAGEVRLVDLVNLYASLAEGGVFRPVRWIEGPPPPAGSRLFSREAAGAVIRILTDVRRPDLPEAWDLTRGVPGVAWKTGTSYGHRDAWAVGMSRRYTIGVWVGNFDGRPRQGISGSQHAGPLLFDLFRSIDPEGVAPAPELVPTETIEVCARSHELPGPWCPALLRVPYLPGRSRLAACSWHRRVLVDASSGELLAGDCLAGRRTAFRLLTVPPAELLAWWRAQGNPVEGPPPLSPACQGVPAGEPPRIVSPDASTPYRMRRDAPPEYQRIPLVARADSGASRLFWYQDGQLVAAMAPQENRFLDSVLGEHRLVVTDDLGRSDAVTYKVE